MLYWASEVRADIDSPKLLNYFSMKVCINSQDKNQIIKSMRNAPTKSYKNKDCTYFWFDNIALDTSILAFRQAYNTTLVMQ